MVLSTGITGDYRLTMSAQDAMSGMRYLYDPHAYIPILVYLLSHVSG